MNTVKYRIETYNTTTRLNIFPKTQLKIESNLISIYNKCSK